MAIKAYKKLYLNPLWLGKGLTITDEEFNDKGFNEVNRAKLKAAIRVGLVEEIDKLVDTADKSLVLDNQVEDLTEKLERITKERDEALDELAEIKGGEADAWVTMSEEELTKAYTVPELRKLIKEEFPEYVLGRGLKEATLAKILFDLIAAELKKDEGTTTENPTGDSEDGTDS